MEPTLPQERSGKPGGAILPGSVKPDDFRDPWSDRNSLGLKVLNILISYLHPGLEER